MWDFIITIVVLIVIKFIYDTVKQSSKIAADGGIRKNIQLSLNIFYQVILIVGLFKKLILLYQ